MEKRLRIDSGAKGIEKAREKRCASRQQAGFDERRLHGLIGLGLGQAVLNRTNTVANLQADIPEESDQLFELLGKGYSRCFRQQDEQIDIRRRPELTATIAADGSQNHRLREVKFAPQVAQDGINVLTSPLEQCDYVLRLLILLAQRGLILDQSMLVTNKQFAARVRIKNHAEVDVEMKTGGGRQPAESVNTS